MYNSPTNATVKILKSVHICGSYILEISCTFFMDHAQCIGYRSIPYYICYCNVTDSFPTKVMDGSV